MVNDRHNEIEQRAYEIWVREGRPSGEHDRHWYRASNEINRNAEVHSSQAVPKASYTPTKVEGALGRRQKRKSGRWRSMTCLPRKHSR
jgi:hypothetical protein